jgi:hypothetical protein
MNPLLIVLGLGTIGAGVYIAWKLYNTPKRRLDRRFKRQEKERIAEEKRVKDSEKKLADVRKEAVPVPTPSVVPIAGAVDANVKSLEEFSIGEKIGWEVTRLVEGQTKRITIIRGMVAIKAGRTGRPPKFMFVKVKRAGRTNLYFVDPQRIIKVTTMQGLRAKSEVTSYKVVFHEFICEPMKSDGTIEYSDELEMILADSGLDQYVQIASSDLGFQLTPTLRNVLIIIGVLGLFTGLAVNGAYHIVPSTVIHWVP